MHGAAAQLARAGAVGQLEASVVAEPQRADSHVRRGLRRERARGRHQVEQVSVRRPVSKGEG